MATNYPSGLDSLSNPAGSDALSTGHASQHANANDAIEAIEGELGLNPRGGSATVKARFDAIEANSWVTSARIADGTITGTDIASGTVTSTNILDGTIVNADINASAAIDVSKLSGVVASAGVGNLLTADNASFETSVAGWGVNGGTSAQSNAQSVSGTYSLALTATSTGNASCYVAQASQTIAVTAGQTYTASIMARSDQASGETASMQIAWKNDAWSTVAATTQTSISIGNSAWGRIVNTGVAPAGATKATIIIYRAAGANGAVTYLDQAGIWQGAGGLWALPGTPIANLGTYTDESVGRRIFTWDTVNSRWQMTFSDSGVRDVAASLLTANGFTSVSRMRIRRQGNTVSINVVGLSRSSGTTGYTAYLSTPSGFGPQDSAAYVRTFANKVAYFDGTSYQVLDPGTSDYFTATFLTNDAWPTALPGSAVGSIPSA